MADIQRPDLKRRLQFKRGLWIGIAMAGLVTAGTLVYSIEPAVPRVERSAVWVDTVREGEFVREVRGPGTLVPKETRWVTAASSGRVERILIRPGASVEADAVLVELSSPELVQEVEERGWEVEAMVADLASREAELERQLLDAQSILAATKAEYESARLKATAEQGLAERGIVSRIQYQQSQLLADQLERRTSLEKERIQRLQASVEAQMDAEHARLEQLRQRHRRYQQRLEDLRVRAGVAGVVQRIDVEEGQQVAIGANIGRVASPDELIAELHISESQVREIQLDQVVTVDTRNAKVEGHVIRIDPAVVNGAVQVDVELTGKLPSGARPDLSVDGTIELERLNDVVFVGRPTYGNPESTVGLFKLGDNGSANRVSVELGRASVNFIEIRTGLEPGDQVILSDTSRWDGHDRIRLDN